MAAAQKCALGHSSGTIVAERLHICDRTQGRVSCRSAEQHPCYQPASELGLPQPGSEGGYMAGCVGAGEPHPSGGALALACEAGLLLGFIGALDAWCAAANGSRRRHQIPPRPRALRQASVATMFYQLTTQTNTTCCRLLPMTCLPHRLLAACCFLSTAIDHLLPPVSHSHSPPLLAAPTNLRTNLRSIYLHVLAQQ